MIWYLQLNFALVFFGILAIGISYLDISSRLKLKTHYMMMLFGLMVLPSIYLIPENNYEYPIREHLASPINFATKTFNSMDETIRSSSISKVISYKSKYISYLIYLIIFGIACLIPWKTIVTYREICQSFNFKRMGNINIRISDKLHSPYAFSFLNSSYVVMPQFLLGDMEQFNLALKHEFQHIRSYDTGWIYLFEIMVSICFLNPILYFWKKQVLLDQEFACDESLIAHNRVLPKAYAICLMQVAKITNPHKMPYGATGMVWGEMKSELSRRIEKMKELKKEKRSLFSAIVGAGLLLFSLSVFSLQAPQTKMRMNQLKDIVDTDSFSEFSIELNEEVLKELNQFNSNSKWQEFARKAIDRYQDHKVLIDSKATEYKLPVDLAAVAFIESGFKNLPSRETSISTKGAGMWQFIPNTARNYGLIVNEELDERLNVSLATDAAMRYLRDNHLLFNDIRLALMSYYVGENKVLKDIAKYKTRDPWTLIKKGHYKTPYLARVMAAAILLKYPSIIN